VSGGILIAHLQHAKDWEILSRGLAIEWADEAGFSLDGTDSQEAADVLLRALLECADTALGRESWLVNNAADISAGRFLDDLPDLALTLSPTFAKAVLAGHFDTALGERRDPRSHPTPVHSQQQVRRRAPLRSSYAASDNAAPVTRR